MKQINPNPTLKCAACGRNFLMDESNALPFCCERCKLIDLGRWLDEEIGLPHEGGPQNGEPINDSNQAPEDD